MMREDLRRECDDIWVIDCSPERHQPDVGTRIFPTVQHAICIVLGARSADKNREVAAHLRFVSLPKGKRTEKFQALAKISLASTDWQKGANDWRSPFLPEATGLWSEFPKLEEIFFDGSPGVKTHRTWIIAPDVESLKRRWIRLQNEKDPVKKDVLFHSDPGEGRTRARYASKVVKDELGSFPTRLTSVAQDKEQLVEPIRFGFRSFDRQWIPPDIRLMSRPRPQLWDWLSDRQIFFTAPEDVSPTNGPPLTLTNLIPDQHHYNGRGGRVYPLWRDAAAKEPNVRPEILKLLAKTHAGVTAEDVFAYIAAVMAHPAFTARFRDDLIQPGLRLPLTADAKLFAQAVALGREVIWLHTYGERFTDKDAGRPKGAPRMKDNAPTIPKDGEIPGAPEPLPEKMEYDAAKHRLLIGKGHVANVSQAMWDYEVSGKEVLRQWFSYRRRDRSRPIIGDRRPPSPLDKIQPDHWLPEYTSDLLDLLNVLGRLIALEPKQADLLTRICEGPLIHAEDIHELLADAAPVENPAKPAKKSKKA
jgi:hypothetical protein